MGFVVCNIESMPVRGDQVTLIGEPLRGGTETGVPLIFFRGAYWEPGEDGPPGQRSPFAVDLDRNFASFTLGR